MSQQIAVRIPDDLVRALDDLVAAGRYATRADAVRAGVQAVVAAERERRIDEQIAEGYRAHPPTPAEGRWADAGRDLIAEEPW